jgi:hypothetical protein
MFMKYLVPLFLCAVASAVLWVGVPCVSAFGRNTEGRSLTQWYLFEMRRREALEQRSMAVAQSLEVKRAAVGDLLANRLTLREAAEQFAEADELIEDDEDVLVAHYRISQTEQQRYRQVIAWARNRLNDRPEQARKIARRLEKELARLSSSVSKRETGSRVGRMVPPHLCRSY